MTDNIRDKVRKLLNLARNDGATEAEAARAMELATALMMKHGISEDQIKEKRSTGKSETIDSDGRWHEIAAMAAGHLYGCRVVRYTGADKFYFVGRDSNREATLDTFEFIKQQIEALYKVNLPKGLSKADRADYRRTFKLACANRVYHRAAEIVKKLSEDDATAVASTGSTALVVVNHRKELEREVDDFFAQEGVRIKQRSSSYKLGRGSLDGDNAGKQVNLNRSVR